MDSMQEIYIIVAVDSYIVAISLISSHMAALTVTKVAALAATSSTFATDAAFARQAKRKLL